MPVNLTSAEQSALEHVLNKLGPAERHRKKLEPRWNHFYNLYRSVSDFRQALIESNRHERGAILLDAKREFGAELFIPIVFTTIETILPRMLSHAPKMQALPDDQSSEDNVENVQYILNRQQEQINYHLTLQDIAKSGLMYGLGVQKTMWRREVRKRRRLVPATVPQEARDGGLARWVEGPLETVVTFDDPDAVAVDIWDFWWDPFGYDIRTCEYVLHRSWRSDAYVRRMMESGQWREIDPRALEGMNSRQRYAEKWTGRAASPERKRDQGGVDDSDRIHEVIEYHDRERVITILDREVPVQDGPNPYWHGDLPFQIYRPTRVPHEFAGIGEVEPIEDLQHEMNTLRSQRRDNATLVLQRVFAYADGLVDPAHLKFGPGVAIPVNGNPSELLFPIPVGDIPHSSYQEEAALQQDIDRTSGISDPIIGNTSSGDTTATEIQLVQASASLRIQNKAKLLEDELIAPAAQQFLALDQQKILTQREVRIPAPPVPGEAERRWAWRTIGPAELAGSFTIVPEGGATQPDNVPQMRHDAQLLMQLLGNNPQVDRTAILRRVVKNLGIDQPDEVVFPEQMVPARVLDVIVQLAAQAGADPGEFQKLVGVALQQVAEQQGG